MDLKIYFTNSYTNKKEKFIPFDINNVKMYVCGPTVYDRAHIGNARSSVVFDVFYRMLKSVYPKVTYVRNITDIDDKIINAANEGDEDIKDLTNRMIGYFHEDLRALNCLLPDYEPKTTENIESMITMIKHLISKGCAYVSEGHDVYFDVNSFAEYGKLSNRKLEELEIGARIEVSKLKHNSLDFVLWKSKKEHEKMFFDSPWGQGRPGWHIECSVMSKELFGDKFDIHGGGVDLIFPHHENEIAQSVCESSSNQFAKYWLHNGFLTVNGNKMSKSLKNFITVKELLNKDVDGAVIRYFYLTAHYRKPLNFNQKALVDAAKSIDKFRSSLKFYDNNLPMKKKELPEEFLNHLLDDLNTPATLAYIHKLSSQILGGNKNQIIKLYLCCELLGLNIQEKVKRDIISEQVFVLAEKRKEAKAQKQWEEADRTRVKIKKLGYKIIDIKEGYKII